MRNFAGAFLWAQMVALMWFVKCVTAVIGTTNGCITAILRFFFSQGSMTEWVPMWWWRAHGKRFRYSMSATDNDGLIVPLTGLCEKLRAQKLMQRGRSGSSAQFRVVASKLHEKASVSSGEHHFFGEQRGQS
jgi:hypothetical protein